MSTQIDSSHDFIRHRNRILIPLRSCKKKGSEATGDACILIQNANAKIRAHLDKFDRGEGMESYGISEMRFSWVKRYSAVNVIDLGPRGTITCIEGDGECCKTGIFDAHELLVRKQSTPSRSHVISKPCDMINTFYKDMDVSERSQKTQPRVSASYTLSGKQFCLDRRYRIKPAPPAPGATRSSPREDITSQHSFTVKEEDTIMSARSGSEDWVKHVPQTFPDESIFLNARVKPDGTAGITLKEMLNNCIHLRNAIQTSIIEHENLADRIPYIVENGKMRRLKALIEAFDVISDELCEEQTIPSCIDEINHVIKLLGGGVTVTLSSNTVKVLSSHGRSIPPTDLGRNTLKVALAIRAVLSRRGVKKFNRSMLFIKSDGTIDDMHINAFLDFLVENNMSAIIESNSSAIRSDNRLNISVDIDGNCEIQPP